MMGLPYRVAACLLPVACLAGAAAPPTAGAGSAIAVLVERAEFEGRRDPDEAVALTLQALRELALKPDADLEMRARGVLCSHHAERDRDAAQAEIDAMRALASKLTRPGLRVMLLNCEGELQELLGDNLQALALYQQAVAVAETSRDDEMLADALVLRGYLRGVQGEFAHGLADLQRARSIYERLGRQAHLQTAMNGVATLYSRMGDLEQARHYFEESLKSQRSDGLRREQVVTEHNLGRTLERLKDWEAARRAFESVLAVSREIDYERGEIYALRGLASVRNAIGDPAQALPLLDRAAQMQAGLPDERLRAQILLQRGIALRLLKRPADALWALREALQVFHRAESAAEEQQTHDELAQAAAALGEWRLAHEHQTSAHRLSELLLRRQLDERFATLKVQFDAAGKDKENALLLREKAATERALQEQRRAGGLQALAVGLASVLALVLGVLAWRHRRTSEKMQGLAMTDELTGLPNRRQVLNVLERLLGTGGAGCAVLLLDLDHFKSINDAFGHAVGDEMLRRVADVLKRASGAQAHVGRIGGEEFVVVLRGAELAQALRVAEGLREDIAALDVESVLGSRRLTASIGIAVNRPDDTISTILRRADEALYEAKQTGRNRSIGPAAAAA